MAALATSSTVADAKADLLELLFEARRGSNADKTLRGQIEEAQVEVEGHSPSELDYSLLAGKWKLLYTTAADVVSQALTAACAAVHIFTTVCGVMCLSCQPMQGYYQLNQ